MKPEEGAAFLDGLLAQLWSEEGLPPGLSQILPRSTDLLRDFYFALQRFLDGATGEQSGKVDPAAMVRGRIVALGEDSIIEAGAVIHESCRLIAGARCRIRPGAILRDEIVVGDDCLIGSHSEVARTVIGNGTALGHHVVCADSVIGSNVLVAAFIGIANTHLRKGSEISIRLPKGTFRTGRQYLGAMVGDGARIGSTVTICPGTVIMPGLSIPPGTVLMGVVDEERRTTLMRDFFARWGNGDDAF